MAALLMRTIAALVAAVVLEQAFLLLAERSLADRPDLVPNFVADIEQSEGALVDACRRYDIYLIYSYRMCADRISGRDYFDVRIEFPAGYLTLIPRDYPDRILFDGLTLAIVGLDGTIQDIPNR